MATVLEPTYAIEADVSPIHSVIQLSIGQVQAHVRSGTLGWYYDGGQLKGPYKPGERINYFPGVLRPGWAGLPGVGDRPQRAILVSTAPQRVQVTIYCPLLGLSTDPAAFTAVVYFEVTDFEKLASRAPGLDEVEGREALNQRVVTYISGIVEQAVQPLANSVYSQPELLTPSGAEKLKDLILANLNLASWGLSIAGDHPPMAHMTYPPSFVQTVYDFRTGYQVFQFNLQKKLEEGDETYFRELMRELTGADAKAAQKVGELIMKGVSPSLEWLVTDGYKLLDAVFAHTDIQLQERSKMLRTALMTRTNESFYNKFIAVLDRDFGQVSSITAYVSEVLQGRKEISAPDWRSYLQGPARSLEGLLRPSTMVPGLTGPWPEQQAPPPPAPSPLGPTPAPTGAPEPSAEPVEEKKLGAPPATSSTPESRAADMLQQIQVEEEQALQGIWSKMPDDSKRDWLQASDGTWWKLELKVGEVEMQLVLGQGFRENGPQIQHIWVAGTAFPVSAISLEWKPGDHITKLVQMILDGYFTS